MLARIKSRFVWGIIVLLCIFFLVYKGMIGPADRIADSQDLESYRAHQFRGRVTEKSLSSSDLCQNIAKVSHNFIFNSN